MNSSKKDELIKEIRQEIRQEIMKEVNEIIDSQNGKINQLESTVALLQQHVSALKHTQNENSKKVEDNEQYGRRLCLRIHGIPCQENETSANVLSIVNNIIKDTESDIPDTVIDRAHRIGKKVKIDKNDGNSPLTQSVIVRFTTFRHRTILYRNRKKLKNVKIQLDLAKGRYQTLSDARKFVDNNPGFIKFVYADINCRLKIRFNDDSEKYFENLDNFKKLLPPYQK